MILIWFALSIVIFVLISNFTNLFLDLKFLLPTLMVPVIFANCFGVDPGAAETGR